MNDTSIAVPNSPTGRALLDYLRPELHRREIVLDVSQLRALDRLQQLHDEFISFVRARRSLLRPVKSGASKSRPSKLREW